MTTLIEQPLADFLDRLASRQPTPGGGSVAALMGAQAAALVAMVCNLTLGKPKYAAVEAEMQQLLQQTTALQSELTAMIQADVDVFNRLMACYGLPKSTDDEKAARSQQLQTVLIDATEVPLACAQACAQAIALSRVAAENGSLGVISDAGVAVMAALAGLKSAALNVRINAASLNDKTWAAAKLAELDALLVSADSDAEQIYQLVVGKL